MSLFQGLALLVSWMFWSAAGTMAYVQPSAVLYDQIVSLQYLYNSTNGDFWKWQDDNTTGEIQWNFSMSSDGAFISNPCLDHWQGVGCSSNCSFSPFNESACDILTLALPDYNISGTLPTQLFAMNTHLQLLDISQNMFTSTFPMTLTLMRDMQTIKLGYNHFSGQILPYLFNISALVTFDATYNAFTGTIPNMLFPQFNTSLLYFNLLNNPITGTIPASIGELKALTFIRLVLNSLTGTIPESITDVTTIQFFAVGLNPLMSGSIPQGIEKLQQVTHFGTIGADLMTGTIPSGLSTLTKLKNLILLYGKITGTLPPLTALNKLSYLHISNTFLTAPPATLIDIVEKPTMSTLYIQNNSFATNFAGADITKSMVFLRLSGNSFSGNTLLPSLCGMTNITELYLDSNMFSGSIPLCINTLSSLRMFDLSHNMLTGSLPSSLGEVSTLHRLLLQGNQLTGDTNTVLTASNLPRLDSVVLSDNAFSGHLPVSMFNSSNLLIFVASKNCFSGSLSTGICAANNLKTLAISGLTASTHCRNKDKSNKNGEGNRAIKGNFPACLFAMPELTQLYADGNGIRSRLAVLPPGSKLQNISLSYNRLSGSIPVSIQTKPDLQLLDLSFNRLLGTMRYMKNYSLTTTVSNSEIDDVVTGNTSSSETPADTSMVVIDGTTGGVYPYQPQCTVKLHTNHLSGYIPSSFTHATSEINVSRLEPCIHDMSLFLYFLCSLLLCIAVCSDLCCNPPLLSLCICYFPILFFVFHDFCTCL